MFGGPEVRYLVYLQIPPAAAMYVGRVGNPIDGAKAAAGVLYIDRVDQQGRVELGG